VNDMNILRRFRKFKAWCPQPKTPFAISAYKISAPITLGTGLSTTYVVISLTTIALTVIIGTSYLAIRKRKI